MKPISYFKAYLEHNNYSCGVCVHVDGTEYYTCEGSYHRLLHACNKSCGVLQIL